ncbi:MAG: hypothetical protein FWH36_05765 [Lentimicrobiaceae bacterium]|nr:hypothetical protein [Lentimicrobiaceae bacterium]
MAKKEYDLEEVFTPAQPAELTYVERDAVLNKMLDSAIKTRGEQIILYGHTGVGKSTLINNKIKNSITTNCTDSMKLRDILLHAFKELDSFYTKNKSSKIGGSISAEYFGIKASIYAETSETLEKSEILTNPQILAKYIGEAKCCWVIEDFHKLGESEKKQMSQIMKVFSDRSVKYSSLKIIVIGAINTAREVVQLDPEMDGRISQIEIPLMTQEELIKILDKGKNLLNVEIPKNVAYKIANYSHGLPKITHQLAKLLCENSNIQHTCKLEKPFEIPKENFDKAVDMFLLKNSGTFKSQYEIATRVDKKREKPSDILDALLEYGKESVSFFEIKKSLKESNIFYRDNSLKNILGELCSSERAKILSLNKESMTYYFSDLFMKSYCFLGKLREEEKLSINDTTLTIIRVSYEHLQKQKPRVYRDDVFDFVKKNYSDLTKKEIEKHIKHFFKKSVRTQEVKIKDGD